MTHGMGPHARSQTLPWRPLLWAIPVALTLMPLVAMQFTDEVAWTVGDFIFAGALFLTTGAIGELVVRKTDAPSYRAGVAVAVLTAVLLIWINGAVGIIGNENNDANLMYGAVLVVLVIGAAVARFRPGGMARTLIATTSVQLLVAVVALVGGLGSDGPNWPLGFLALTAFFVMLWLASAWLFSRAATR